MHRINARAEVRVTNELVKEFKRVTGKENLLFNAGTVDDQSSFPTGPSGGL